ncbi:Peroxisome chaperone and import receptor [Onygenales sp. PD_40]|nr:Peroxisome chaperone and import receptor [Onygenales sp. PD_40]KAK2782197.1 Peroxisome chaperone and import receptor [Onygenales sp. PD_12]KAK2800199.1 Peroxisome chaperone and import receptor [Onygenales sp. PD_10]
MADDSKAAATPPPPPPSSADAVAVGQVGVKQEEQQNKADAATTTTAAAAVKVEEPEDEDEDDEDLEAALDAFSIKPTPAAPSTTKTTQPPTTAPATDETANLDQADFSKLLEESMAELLGTNTTGPAGADADAEPDWDALAQRMAQGNMDHTEIMKLMMGEGGPAAFAGDNTMPAAEKEKESSSSSSNNKPTVGGFQDTIRKTMERLQDSGDKAAEMAAEGGVDDVLMQLLKAIDTGASTGVGGEGDGEDLDKMFMGIMEQLSNKEMLYEPMKELDGKFGPWLEENKEKVSKEDLERYREQAGVVREIVAKFDEAGYSDEKAECRAFIWEKMQKMQAAGSPPDDLISNPLADEMGIQSALAGGGQDGPELPPCPQQ